MEDLACLPSIVATNLSSSLIEEPAFPASDSARASSTLDPANVPRPLLEQAFPATSIQHFLLSPPSSVSSGSSSNSSALERESDQATSLIGMTPDHLVGFHSSDLAGLSSSAPPLTNNLAQRYPLLSAPNASLDANASATDMSSWYQSSEAGSNGSGHPYVFSSSLPSSSTANDHDHHAQPGYVATRPYNVGSNVDDLSSHLASAKRNSASSEVRIALPDASAHSRRDHALTSHAAAGRVPDDQWQTKAAFRSPSYTYQTQSQHGVSGYAAPSSLTQVDGSSSSSCVCRQLGQPVCTCGAATDKIANPTVGSSHSNPRSPFNFNALHVQPSSASARSLAPEKMQQRAADPVNFLYATPSVPAERSALSASLAAASASGPSPHMQGIKPNASPSASMTSGMVANYESVPHGYSGAHWAASAAPSTTLASAPSSASRPQMSVNVNPTGNVAFWSTQPSSAPTHAPSPSFNWTTPTTPASELRGGMAVHSAPSDVHPSMFQSQQHLTPALTTGASSSNSSLAGIELYERGSSFPLLHNQRHLDNIHGGVVGVAGDGFHPGLNGVVDGSGAFGYAHMSKPMGGQVNGSSPSLYDTEEGRWNAILRRSHAADSHFVYGALTTRIYCRPSCASKRPDRGRVQFFSFPDAAIKAEASGFRACKRCKPGTPGTADVCVLAVGECLRHMTRAALLGESDEVDKRLKRRTLKQYSSDYGVSAFHFHRTLKNVCTLTPGEYSKAAHSLVLQDELGIDRFGRPLEPEELNAKLRGWSTRRARRALGNVLPNMYAAGLPDVNVQYVVADQTAFGRVVLLLTLGRPDLSAHLHTHHYGASSAHIGHGSGGLGDDNSAPTVLSLLIGNDSIQRATMRCRRAVRNDERSAWLTSLVNNLAAKGTREVQMPPEVIPWVRRARVYLACKNALELPAQASPSPHSPVGGGHGAAGFAQSSKGKPNNVAFDDMDDEDGFDENAYV